MPWVAASIDCRASGRVVLVTPTTRTTIQKRTGIGARSDSPVGFVARAFLLAIRRFPAINARWGEEAQQIVFQLDANFGIAAATPRGLMAPTRRTATS